MGLIADLPNSYFTLVDHTDEAPTAYAVANEVVCKMQQFQTIFRFKYVSDPHLGVKPPARTESWRIGIVQNVLYEKNHFVWDPGPGDKHQIVHNKEWTRPVVDSGAKYSFPLYFDEPAYPQTKSDIDTQMLPYRDVYYNSTGFGELVEPWKAAPNDIVLKPSLAVTAADHPQFGCSLRTRSGGQLRTAQQIVTFGIWLVAFDPAQSRPVVLANIPPFSLVYSADWSIRGTGLLEFGDSNYVFYSVAGYTKHVNTSLANSNASGGRMTAGKGAHAPILMGETANQRERHWAVATILAV